MSAVSSARKVREEVVAAEVEEDTPTDGVVVVAEVVGVIEVVSVEERVENVWVVVSSGETQAHKTKKRRKRHDSRLIFRMGESLSPGGRSCGRGMIKNTMFHYSPGTVPTQSVSWGKNKAGSKKSPAGVFLLAKEKVPCYDIF
jgi:hypothetical protein